jgi:toxin ParE1/3/4
MQIEWLESAFADLQRIRDYIRQFNPVVAQGTVACIETAAKNLARFPEMGHSGEVPGTRELVIPSLPYFLVYRLKGDHVQILRVLHERQKWPPALQ